MRGIPEIMVYRILMFMWSFGPKISVGWGRGAAGLHGLQGLL